jgi:formyltetrahydrofolate-dependent phosphoribosylglycinamide formyltransferase
LVVLASGSGTTLQALIESFGDHVVAAGTDRPESHAMRRAQAAGIETFAVALADYADRTAWNAALAERIASHRPDLVVLAGFMKILDRQVVDRFSVINTHPALLPAFPGAHAVRDALAHGVQISGVTVHRVDSGVDTGPILAQAAVEVRPGDDEAALQARIQSVEKPLYIATIRQLIEELSA